VSQLARIQELLPPPYAVEADSVLAAFLDRFALEMESFSEDLDRMRQSHWIGTAYRFADAVKLGALAGVPPLPWEALQTYRARLLDLIAARLAGALSPGAIRRFVHDYLVHCEDLEVLGCSLVHPPLPAEKLADLTVDEAFGALQDAPRFQPLALVENPPRRRRSDALQAVAGRVPYLYRWRETNRGLDETVPTFYVSGLSGKRTAVPVLVNRSTGELLGWAGTVPYGRILRLRPGAAADPGAAGAAGGAGAAVLAAADLDGDDVSGRLFGKRGFALGVPFAKAELDPQPRMPRLARGANDWIFLALGLYDVRGLDHFFSAIADEALYEAVYDQTAFDHSLFPSGPVAQLEMEWTETEPAAFAVRVPRAVALEPPERVTAAGRPYEQVADGLIAAVAELHAAGVRAEVQFMPFAEAQPQAIRFRSGWQVIDPEPGPAGVSDRLTFGSRFGETPLGEGRLG
jgi:hypothetical protein